jgi:hypothetical protein
MSSFYFDYGFSLKKVRLRDIPMGAVLRTIMIRALIMFIAQKHEEDLDTASVDSCILNQDESIDALYNSRNQIFAFLKFARRICFTGRSA